MIDVLICSPPYADSVDSRSGPSGLKGVGGTGLQTNGRPLGMSRADLQMNKEGYGHTPGQLGSLKEGSFPITEEHMTKEQRVGSCVPVDEWPGLFDQSWKDLIVGDAFAHP